MASGYQTDPLDLVHVIISHHHGAPPSNRYILLVNFSRKKKKKKKILVRNWINKLELGWMDGLLVSFALFLASKKKTLIVFTWCVGFEDAASGCCATGIFEMGYMCNTKSLFTCQDANKFVFWDAFHPTERMNRIVADQLMNTTLSIFK